MVTHKQDVATLIELLKMAAERWPRSDADQVSQSELLREDHSLLEMWPEACRRTGVGRREFPPGVIKLWNKDWAGRIERFARRRARRSHLTNLMMEPNSVFKFSIAHICRLF